MAELAARAASLDAASGGNLLECFAAVPDPRAPRGIRHSLPCVLALCTAAVLCGNTAIEDVTAWVHHAPPEVLAAAGARRNALGMLAAPHPDTVVRLFTGLGAQTLAHHAGSYLALPSLPRFFAARSTLERYRRAARYRQSVRSPKRTASAA